MAATQSAKPKRSVGRPRAGLTRDGAEADRVRDYRTFTVRLPDDVRVLLQAVAKVLNKPMWRTIDEIVCFYVKNHLKVDEHADYARVIELVAESWQSGTTTRDK
jgi:hypothetical protein